MQNASAENDRPLETVAFNVLFHRHPAGDHYDLLIEHGPSLATWKLPQPPESVDPAGILCTRIADHRRLYLDYEGPISGDRGFVTRHDTGTCDKCCENPGEWLLTFDGRRLRGAARLSQSESSSDQWWFRRLD